MARRSLDIEWMDHRYALLAGLVALAVGAVFCISSLVGADGIRVERRHDDEGRTIEDYFKEKSMVPFKTYVYGPSGDLQETRFDVNENGNIESRHFYEDGVLVEQSISIHDEGVYDLHRSMADPLVLERYDRNHDGFVEEKHYLRHGLRFRDEFDWNKDGLADQTIIYDERGKPLRIEIDSDSDGKVDRVQSRGSAGR